MILQNIMIPGMDQNFINILMGSVAMIFIAFTFRKMWQRLHWAPFLWPTPFFLIAFPLMFVIIGVMGYAGIDIGFLLDKIGLLLMALFFFSGYLYFEALINVRPNLIRLMIAIAFLIILITIILLNIFSLYTSGYIIFYTFASGLFTAGFGMSVTLKMLKIFNHKGLKIEFLALLLLFIGSIIILYMDFSTSSGLFPADSGMGLVLYFISAIFLVATIFSLCFEIIFFDNYVPLLPLPIHSVLIFDQKGELIYNHYFSVMKDNSFKERGETLSNVLIKFSSFFKEILGTKAKLTYIDAFSYNFHFSEFSNSLGTMVVVASESNYYLKHSINKFTKKLPKETLGKINDKSQDLHKEFDNLLKDAFPYLELHS